MTLKDIERLVELNESTSSSGNWRAAGFIYDDVFDNPRYFVCITDGTQVFFKPDDAPFLKYAKLSDLEILAKRADMTSNDTFAEYFKRYFDDCNIRTKDSEYNLDRIVNNFLTNFVNSSSFVYVYAKLSAEEFPILVFCDNKQNITNITIGLPGEIPRSISNLSYALDRSSEEIRNKFDRKYGTGHQALYNFIKDSAKRSKGDNAKFVKNLQEFFDTSFDKNYTLKNVRLYKDFH